MEKLPSFDSFPALDATRENHGTSLALLRPRRLIKLEIAPVDHPAWTNEDMAKLLQEQIQGQLFSADEERRQLKLLKKLPFDFYYHYACGTPGGEQIYKHKIVDWEVGMLFWNCKQSHGNDWEAPFRAKLEADFGSKDLMFMMGNIHRFQHQWLIISLMYPPKRTPEREIQSSLF